MLYEVTVYHGGQGWMAGVSANCGSSSKRLLAHIWVEQEIECREYWPSVGFSIVNLFWTPSSTFRVVPKFNLFGNILKDTLSGVSPR